MVKMGEVPAARMEVAPGVGSRVVRVEGVLGEVSPVVPPEDVLVDRAEAGQWLPAVVVKKH